MRKALLFTVCLVVFLALFSSLSARADNDPGEKGKYRKCTYVPPANSGYYKAMVWYPCDFASEKFAATTLTSGFTGTYPVIAYLADHLVTHGYIVFAMTPNNIYGMNASWTSAHKAGIAQLKIENTRTGTIQNPNPIRGKVDTSRLQVMGHSKGGGGALLAAADLGASVKTVQALAPYMDGRFNLRNVRAATNIMTSTADSIAKPDRVVSMYNSLPDSIARTLMFFSGMDHMVYTATGNKDYQKRTTRYITAFMKYHLDGLVAYKTYLYGADHNSRMWEKWFYGYAHNIDF